MENGRQLGEEKISKLILKYSIPCILSLLISSLYNIVDQIFIGNSSLSTLGNAATGIVFPLFIITNAFAWWFGDGCAAYMNICQGRKDDENAHKAIGTCFTLTFLTGLILIATLMPLKRNILLLVGASKNNIDYASEYFTLILIFFPVYMVTAMADCIIRADGSPSYAMIAMSMGAITNIVLDPLFIFLLNLGMTGASLATVIGQTVSFILCIAYLFKTKTFKLTAKSFIPNFKIFSDSFKLGFSSFLNQITIVAISLLCNVALSKYGATSKYGADIPLAVIGIENKIFTILLNLIVGLVLGCQPIISYNIGAKKYNRVKKIFYDVLICTVLISLIFTALIEIFPKPIASLFGEPTNIPNPTLYWEFAEKTFRIFLMLVIFTCVVKFLAIFLQATGNPVMAVISSLVRDILIFAPLLLILPKYFGIEGLLWAAPISDFISIIFATAISVKFMKGLKENKLPIIEVPVIKDSKEGIIVTIAREHGSAGKSVGRLIAEKLQVPFYCKEVISLVAKESGLDKEYLDNLDKNDKENGLYALYCSTANTIATAISAQNRIINEIANRGSSVIVGRAADYFLRNKKNVIKVFVKASEETKIKNIMNMYGDTYENAKTHIEKSDKARAKYYKTVTGRNWKDFRNYDLVLDSSNGVDKCADSLYEFLIKNFAVFNG